MSGTTSQGAPGRIRQIFRSIGNAITKPIVAVFESIGNAGAWVGRNAATIVLVGGVLAATGTLPVAIGLFGVAAKAVTGLAVAGVQSGAILANAAAPAMVHTAQWIAAGGLKASFVQGYNFC